MIKKITFKGDCPLHVATYKREDNIIPDIIYIQGNCIYDIVDIIIQGNDVNRILLPYNNHKIEELLISNHYNDTLIEIGDSLKPNLKVYSQSGKIILNNTILNECNLTSIAGGIILNNSSFNTLEISGFSDPIIIEKSTINKQAILRNSYGEILINESNIKCSKIRTDSGDIIINDCNKDFEQIFNIRSSDGMIKVNNSKMMETRIHTLLGTISINNSIINKAELGIYKEDNKIIIKKSQIESLKTESYLSPKIIESEIMNHSSTILEDILPEGNFKTSGKILVLK